MNRSNRDSVLCIACLLLSTALTGCDRRSDPVPDQPPADLSSGTSTRPVFQFKENSTVRQVDLPVVRFDDVAEQSGVVFTYHNGAHGLELMVESTGGGVAWLDFDRDRLLDLYFTQGGDAASADRSSAPLDQLFRQTSPGVFVTSGQIPVTAAAEYSMGVAAADFDNDGFPDIYVTNVGHNHLLRNLGDGTFEDITEISGTDDERWSTTAAWADLDQDGDLDLYCCNYLQYNPFDPLICEKDGRPALCHPRDLDASADECFENLGDGTFRRVSQDWGLFGEGNKGLGVVIADLNNDSRPDVYVANDTTANFLFLNQGAGRFRESALRFGGALNAEGAMQASMGIAIGDYDSNGLLDLFLTHFTGESNTLYQNLGGSGLHDVSSRTGIRRISYDYLGFGTVMHDFDQNGTLELLVANGHVNTYNADGAGAEQTACLMTFVGPDWVDLSNRAGDYFTQRRKGRAVAMGDYDRDGDMDIAIANQNQPAALLKNVSPRGQWLKIRLIGRTSNRSAIGTRVTVTGQGNTWMQELVGGSSYCATNEPVLIFGLDRLTTLESVEILWPRGHRQQLTSVDCCQELVLIEPDQTGL